MCVYVCTRQPESGDHRSVTGDGTGVFFRKSTTGSVEGAQVKVKSLRHLDPGTPFRYLVLLSISDLSLIWLDRGLP